MALTGYYTVNNEEMGFRYEAIRHKLVAMRKKLRGCGMDPLLYCCLLCQSWTDIRHILFHCLLLIDFVLCHYCQLGVGH